MPLFLPQGLFLFPGIDTFISAQYTLAHGITPGMATFIIPPQATPPSEGGPLYVSFDDGLGWLGNAVNMQFPDCKIDQATYRKTQSGFVWQIDILDRRWKWAFGAISGLYNVRAASGDIIDGTEKTPQELAQLCFEALGESGYDVSLMPNDARPQVVWDQDNPAQELAQLCEDLGCRIVPTLSGTFKIYPVGIGDVLPQGGQPITDGSAEIDPPEVPDNITVVCGQTRFQTDLLLDAVGEDTDGSLKLIDDLSYKPTNGWDPPGFFNVLAQFDAAAQARAQRTVFRYYRVYEHQFIPGYHSAEDDQTESLREIVLLDPVQNRSYADDADGNPIYEPAKVFGVFFDGNGLHKNTETALTHEMKGTNTYKGGFHVDKERRMLVMREHLYKQGTDDLGVKIWTGAELFYRCTVAIRQPETLAYVRHSRTEPSGSTFGTPDRVVKRYDLIKTTIPDYEIDESVESLVGSNADVSTNETTINAELDEALAMLWASYETETPLTLRYAGLLPIEPNGVIYQVTWSADEGGAFTVASQSQEVSKYTMSYQQRRQLERNRGLPERGKRFGAPGENDGSIKVFI